MGQAETGNYYYGARYYDPKISVWLSVDPMSAERSWLTPYNFVQNNPLMRVDPDGMLDDWQPNGDGTYTAEAGDGAWTLAEDAGISFDDAKQILADQGMGTYVDEDGVEKSAVDPGDVVAVSNGTNGNEASLSGSGKSVFNNTDEFWQIEPTYSADDLNNELWDRAKGVAGDKALDQFMKGGGRTPIMIDAPDLIRQKVIFAAKGRLKTIGPGSVFVMPIVTHGDNDTVGLFFLSYTPDSTFKEEEFYPSIE